MEKSGNFVRGKKWELCVWSQIHLLRAHEIAHFVCGME